MAEELQGLLERIHQETVKKADDEKDKIISAAKAEAAKILSTAKTEADELRKKAGEDAVQTEARAKAAVQQASRDILLSLKGALQARLANLVKNSVGKAMTPDLMSKILVEMVKGYCEKGLGSDLAIELLLPEKDVAEMEKLFRGSLMDDLKAKPEIVVARDFPAGMKLNFKGNDVFFDFSDEAISELICLYAGPKLTELLSSDK
ncbi:MAG: hypothetical protein A2017_04835 [Lentisphaerae bacterium GWF2_44_16]|nr:MAG: hypothetical protein A2017_04835 [Lentisphaerae bacterium GWF2_44_16]